MKKINEMPNKPKYNGKMFYYGNSTKYICTDSSPEISQVTNCLS